MSSNFRVFRVAFFAVKLDAQFFSPAFCGQNPFARNQRRFVPDVLVMPAVEFGAPIVFVIFVKTDDFSLHLGRFKIQSSRFKVEILI